MAARPVNTGAGGCEKLGKSPGLGDTFQLPVSAGHLFSMVPKTQLGPIGVSQEADSQLNLSEAHLEG